MVENPNKPIINVRTSVIDDESQNINQEKNGASTTPINPTPSIHPNTEVNQNTDQGQKTSPAQSSVSGSSQQANGSTSYPQLPTTIPDEFKGSTYQEVIDYYESKIKEKRPLSKEALEKIRKRQKAEGIISGISDAVMAVANLVGTHNYAPSMYNATEGMSAKAKARFEKEKADRDAEDDRYFNLAMTLGKLKAADKDRGLQTWQIEQNLQRQERAFNADLDFRNRDFDERMRQWQANFDRQGEWHKEESDRWERQFKESIRQFDVSSANDRARLGLEAQRLAQSIKQGQMTFNLGSGNGNVSLSLDKLNAQTVSRIFSTLPKGIRENVKGDPIVKDGFIVGNKPPTTEAMLIAIGANVETSPATQNAIRQVAGLEKGQKPAGY